MKYKMIVNNKEYAIETNDKNDWTDVFIDDQFKARVISKCEARRVCWLDLIKDGIEIDFVSDEMFVEMENETYEDAQMNIKQLKNSRI